MTMDKRMIEQLAAERGRPFCNPNTCERLAIASELAAKMKVRALRAERLAETAREDCEGGRAVLATPEILEGMRKNGYVLDDEFYLPDGSVRQHWSYAEPGKPAGAASELERLELRAAGLARALEELSAENEELRAENKRLKRDPSQSTWDGASE